MPRYNAKSTEYVFVTDITKPSRIDRLYKHLTSLIQFKRITVLLPRIRHFITRRLFTLNYGGIPFIW